MAVVLGRKGGGGGGGGGGAPTGPAGGSLGGTYPNPSIANLAVDTAQIAAGAVTAAKVAADVATQAELDAVAAAAVANALYDANTVLAANADNTPLALTMGASTILARLAAGNIVAATPAQINTLLGGPVKLFDFTVAGADQAVIDTNVDAGPAGVLSGAYAVLEIWALVKTDVNGGIPSYSLNFNNDTGANYDTEGAFVINATNTGYFTGAATSIQLEGQGSVAAASTYPSVNRLTIPGYAATTFFKVAELTSGGMGTTGATSIAENAVVGWRSTAAITRVALTAAGATKFKVGSRLLIYGR